MKKVIVIILIIVLLSNIGNNKKEDLLRIRVLANSNSEYDQNIKMRVSKTLQLKLYDLLKDKNNIEEARKTIKSNINMVEDIIDRELKEETYGYTVNYGYNYFPDKEYNGKKYKSGSYESLLIKLGEGKGDNWWCILFPPMCLIDVEENESEDVEYSFFLKDIFNKIFN